MAFPLAIFVVIVAGALLVTQARFTHETDAQAETAPSYTKKDHWHAAYGLYVCDHFLPPLNDVKDDKTGIHTHGEGIIHIHPFTAAASGLKAQLHIFADQIGLTLGDDGFKTPDGTEYHNGFDCKGKPGKFAVYKFKVDDPTATVEVFEKDINKINFTEDRDAYTIAILPEGAAEPPPMPDSVAELDRLSDVDQSSTGAGAGAGQDPSVSIPTGIDPSLSVPDLSTPTASTPTVSDPTASTPTVSDPTASVSTPPTPAPSTP